MGGSTIIARLRTGIPREEMLSPFEPLAIPAGAILALGFATVAATLLLTSFEIRADLGLPVFTSCLLIPAMGMLARRYGMRAASDLLQATGALALISLLMQIGCIFITPLTLGWADDSLAAADRALHFPWIGVLHWFQRHPEALDWNRTFYRWLMIEPPIVVVLMVALRQRERLWTFVNAWAIALVMTLAIYLFFPAKGPFWLYGIKPADLPGLTTGLPWKFPVMIESLRNGSLRVIGGEFGMGLVSFPSFHAAGAVLLAWAMWPRPLLRFPFLLFNIGVLGSAIISGGHYFIDLIGGAAVAVLSTGVASVIMARRRPAPDNHPMASPHS